MQRTAEAVSLGHPDKIADYISSYILDRLIEQDPNTRYAVEVMIKDNTVVLGGEVTTTAHLGDLTKHVRSALSEIGYDERYASIWGKYAIDPAQIKVINMIGVQSSDIAQGVDQDGWGDQGVFVGYACKGDGKINRELYLAKKLNYALYTKAHHSDNLGLDIKTQITLNDDRIETAIVAIPMLRDEDLTDAGEVVAIYVLSEYYGRKIGYRLMNEAFARLSGYDTIFVWVLEKNERAIRFYHQYGFEFDGCRKQWNLGTPVSIVRMIKKRA